MTTGEPLDLAGADAFAGVYGAFVAMSTIGERVEGLQARLRGAVRSKRVMEMDFLP